MTDDRLIVSDVDDGLEKTLADLIYEFNVDATGFDDGRFLGATFRADDGSLEAGLSGWTWGGCAYVDHLWVRADLRGTGLGSRLLAAAEAEATARGCFQVIVFSHTFQAPDFYLQRGYAEYARTRESPRGHADVHLVKALPPAGDTKEETP